MHLRYDFSFYNLMVIIARIIIMTINLIIINYLIMIHRTLRFLMRCNFRLRYDFGFYNLIRFYSMSLAFIT